VDGLVGLGIFALLVGFAWVCVRLLKASLRRDWERFARFAEDYLETSRRRPAPEPWPVDEVGVERDPVDARCSVRPRPTPVDMAGVLRPSCPPGPERLVDAVVSEPVASTSTERGVR
jgi:hypothetical protein